MPILLTFTIREFLGSVVARFVGLLSLGWLLERKQEKSVDAYTITEARELITQLHEALTEANRQCDNFQFEARQLRAQLGKAETECTFYRIQMERMNLTLKKHELNYDDTKDKPVTPPAGNLG